MKPTKTFDTLNHTNLVATIVARSPRFLKVFPQSAFRYTNPWIRSVGPGVTLYEFIARRNKGSVLPRGARSSGATFIVLKNAETREVSVTWSNGALSIDITFDA